MASQWIIFVKEKELLDAVKISNAFDVTLMSLAASVGQSSYLPNVDITKCTMSTTASCPEGLYFLNTESVKFTYRYTVWLDQRERRRRIRPTLSRMTLHPRSTTIPPVQGQRHLTASEDQTLPVQELASHLYMMVQSCVL
jgi:hypothetical protein